MRRLIIKSQGNHKDNKLRWNFAMGLLHGIFFRGGMAFADPNTILPVFLNNFTSSKILIGLSSTIMGGLGGISGVLPQMFVANRLESRSHKKPVLIISITIRALCWGLLSLITYLFAISNPGLTVFSFFLLLIIFTFMGGVAVIPFMDIWGKAIPSTLRGRFFGHRQLWGGIAAIGSGFIVKAVLGNKGISFSDKFALIFLLTFFLLSISYLALASVKEPVEEVYKNQLSFRRFLVKAFKILKFDSNYRNFLLVQILSGSNALALPFYVLYARNSIGVRLGMIGIFLSAQMLGSILSNPLWGYLSDFVGNRRVIQMSTFLGLVVPLIALVITSRLSLLFILLFIVEGFFMAGRNIGNTNFLLDMAPPKDRPTYVSLNGTLTFPVSLFPLIGGIIIQYVSYNFLFMITSSVIFIGFVLSLKLIEPRKGSINGKTIS